MAKGRRLWLEAGESILDWKPPSSDDEQDSYDAVLERFATRPSPVPLQNLISNSLVVGQECLLTTLFLAGHRAIQSEKAFERSEEGERLLSSMFIFWLALFLVVLNNKPQNMDAVLARKTKLRHRAMDGLFMAVLLRFLAAVLKTLTASYSSDTVHALAVSGFTLHLMACDYSYANGRVSPTHTTRIPRALPKPGAEQSSRPLVPMDTTKRPAFQGGTLSLTAAFFATTLLASRLKSNRTVYAFVLASVVLFALYPAARHQVAINTQHQNRWGKIVHSKRGTTFRLAH